jgi:CheY-like chemotaxis protein
MSELRNVLAHPFIASKEEQIENKGEEEEYLDFSGKRVLLVEDNQMNQILAENILTSVGFAVDIASDGIEAVEKMKSSSDGYYDVILMDIQMPQMDGYEATRQIRALDDKTKSEIPIVAVTANAFEEDRKISMEVGMNGYLAKPYDVPEIMSTLKELLF